MARLFSPRANLIARTSLLAVVLAAAGIGLGAYAYTFSAYRTGVGVDVPQLVPFSHFHHVSGLGIDCRFCHAAVEESTFAGMPSTDTCMTCHWQLWTDSPMLAPVRQSWRTGKPLQWARVHDLPDYSYFDHSVHVAAGVGCSTCHGRVDQMPLVHKTETLYMRWCLECHRDPGPNLRPREEVFNMAWTPAASRDPAHDLLVKNGVSPEGLADCSACHR